MRRSLFALVTTIGVAGAIGDARANGRYPQAGQAVVSPASAQHLFVRATFGLLVSKDGGASWDWICEGAFGYTGTGDPMIGVTRAEAILVATPNGLWVSPDGCAWARAGGVGDHVVTDLVVRADDPSSALAVTSDYAGTDGGASVFASQVFATSDDGATWAALGAPVDPPLLVATIEAAKSDPARVLLSAIAGGATTTGAKVIASLDRGAHWSAYDVPLVAGELGAYLAAIDPNDASRVYLRTAGTSGGTARGRLLASDDGGQTWRAAYAGGALYGFALSPDGSEVFVGGLWPGDGLLAAPRASLAFAPRASRSIMCLASAGAPGAIDACFDARAQFPFGASTDDGATFAPKLDFRAIRGPLACPAGSATDVCAAQWPALRAQLGIGADAGTAASDAGVALDAALPSADASAAPPPSDASAPAAASRSGCACEGASGRTSASPRAPLAWLAAALAALAALRRGSSRPLRAPGR